MSHEAQIPHSPATVDLDRERGLAIIDVDEVLALFVQGFDRFLRSRGFELRMRTFALFSNLYRLGEEEPADLSQGRDLLGEFFAVGCADLEPAPGAIEGLARLSKIAQVVILTNAPEAARVLRGQWLKAHHMDYPLILGEGLKGPPVAVLAGRVAGPVIFVDDLLSNLDSVASAAPRVKRYQMVADPDLRRLAPSDPSRHPLVDHWDDLLALSAPLFSS